MENENKGKERKDFKDRVFPTFGHFPMGKWAEYDKEVEQKWAGCRWAKAWHDHELAKSASKEEAMWNAILELKQQIVLMRDESEKSEEADDDDKPVTFGDVQKKDKKNKEDD